MTAAKDLSTFFERVYRPIKLASYGVDYISQYRTAIRWLAQSLGRAPTTADLTPEALEAIAPTLKAEGLGGRRAWQVQKRLRALWLYADRLGLAEPYRRPAAPPNRATDPEPDEGTVRHFFETVYRPQKLLGSPKATVKGYRRVLRTLRKHYGRDVALEEQTDQLAADHFEWLLAKDLKAVSVNAHRTCWFAVWRWAHTRGLVERLPLVPKLREELDEPDAWSPEEAKRIIEATKALATWPPISGIPAHAYFRAFLLVAWWTALRRGSLLKIARKDVDLQGGWLNVPGKQMKNRRGRRHRLGPDAIEAIRAIWLPERKFLFPVRNDFYSYFDEILRVAEIPPSTRDACTKLHKWRRTVATQAAVTHGIETATAMLNQSGRQVTMRYIDPTKLPGNDATQILPSLTD